jgi:dsRNA-specific ribonuclease
VCVNLRQFGASFNANLDHSLQFATQAMKTEQGHTHSTVPHLTAPMGDPRPANGVPSSSLLGSQKRPLEDDAATFTLPELPKIGGELTLEVFTHDSLRYDGYLPNTEHGDHKRIAELGSKVLESAIMYALFRKKPPLSAEQMRVS